MGYYGLFDLNLFFQKMLASDCDPLLLHVTYNYIYYIIFERILNLLLQLYSNIKLCPIFLQLKFVNIIRIILANLGRHNNITNCFSLFILSDLALYWLFGFI